MFLGSYWVERPASASRAASLLVGFLSDLGEIDNRLSTWYLPGKGTGAKPVQMDPVHFEGYLTPHRRDSDNQVMPELGWTIALWNGGAVSYSACVGAYAAHVTNNALLKFKSQKQGPSLPEQEAILQLMVRHFDPDYAVATSHELLERHGAELPWEAAWLSYERGGSIQSRGSPY